jgi:hypothetical protein
MSKPNRNTDYIPEELEIIESQEQSEIYNSENIEQYL